jgi:hypothetical protein
MSHPPRPPARQSLSGTRVKASATILLPILIQMFVAAASRIARRDPCPEAKKPSSEKAR